MLSEKNYHSGHMPAHQLRLLHSSTVYPVLRYFSIKACQPPEQSTLSPRWSQSTVEHRQFFISLKGNRRVNSTLLDGPSVTWRCHTGRLTCRAALVHCGAAFQPGVSRPHFGVGRYFLNVSQRAARCGRVATGGQFLCFASKFSLQLVAPVIDIIQDNRIKTKII